MINTLCNFMYVWNKQETCDSSHAIAKHIKVSQWAKLEKWR